MSASAPTALANLNILASLAEGIANTKTFAIAGNVASEFTDEENIMNWDVIKGDWMQFKGHVKEQWGKLTDDNLDQIAGKRDQLAGKVQEAYGVTKDQAETQVKAFEEMHKDYQPKISA